MDELTSGRGSAVPLRRWQKLLVVTQAAIAMVLVTAGGLLIRSYVELARVDLGFRTDNVLSFQVSPSDAPSAPPAPAAAARMFAPIKFWASRRVRHVPADALLDLVRGAGFKDVKAAQAATGVLEVSARASQVSEPCSVTKNKTSR